MKKCNFWLYFSFSCGGFGENSYLSLYTHSLKMFILIGKYLSPNFWKRNVTYFVYFGFC